MLFKAVIVGNFNNVAASAFLKTCLVLNIICHYNYKLDHHKTIAAYMTPTLTSFMSLRFGRIAN